MIKGKKYLSTKIQFMVNKFQNVRHHIRQTWRSESCIFCHTKTRAQPICQGCREDLPWNLNPCTSCALPLPAEAGSPQLCGDCMRDKPSFDHCITPFTYDFPIDRCIHRIKYKGKRRLLRALAKELETKIPLRKQHHPFPDVIIAVPLDPKRRHDRTLNHCSYLSKTLGKAMGVPFKTNLLIKTSSTPEQSSLSRKLRLKNLKGVFEVRGSIPTRIALVDDVLTTGATAETIARLLKKHGAEHVEVWALARTPKPGD